MAQQLATLLNDTIDSMATEDRPRADIVTQLVAAAGVEESVVDEILESATSCPPREQLVAFADVLDVTLTALFDAAAEDGCAYEDDSEARSAWKATIRAVAHYGLSGSADALRTAGAPDMLVRLAELGMQNVTGNRVERATSMNLLYSSIWHEVDELDYMDADGIMHWHWLQDVYIAEDGVSMFAIISVDGTLVRADITVDESAENIVIFGELVRVVEVFQPVETRMIVRESASGRRWWYSVSNVSVLNRSNQIDSRALYESFVVNFNARMLAEHNIDLSDTDAFEAAIPQLETLATQVQAQATPVVDGDGNTLLLLYSNPLPRSAQDETFPPRRNLYHDRSQETGTVLFISADNNLLIEAGVFDDTPLADLEQRAIAASPEFFGESIEFWSAASELAEIETDAGVTVRFEVHTDGVYVGTASLPTNDAASLLTAVAITQERRMNAQTQGFLTALGQHTGDDVTPFIESADRTNREIDEAAKNGQVIRRSVEGGAPETSGEDELTTEQRLNEIEQSIRMMTRAIAGGDMPAEGDMAVLQMLMNWEGGADAVRSILDAVGGIQKTVSEINRSNEDRSAEIGTLRKQINTLQTRVNAGKVTRKSLLAEVRDQLAPQPIINNSEQIERAPGRDGVGNPSISGPDATLAKRNSTN